ncbi:MAG: pyridoxamine kinase [Roseburia sp.]|nr:pyridoxamine kinase [Roseburia sp.]
MANKRILTMQDLSCVGQCSLTVALPILSSYGIETCVLPTAILSNHTMFESWSYLDLTEETQNIFKHWENNDIKFDAYLLGYLGKTELMSVAEKCFDKFSNDGAQIIIDPVFGDNGKLYPNFDKSYVDGMRKLIKRADVILPNVTEACFLTETPYTPEYDGVFVEKLGEKLSRLTNGKVIVTGAIIGKDIAEFIYNDKDGEILLHEKLPQNKHGTGDIFSSVFTANYLSGKDLHASCNTAAAFVTDCLKNTDADHFYGVNFERVLKRGK